MASYSLHMADSGTDNFDRDFALSLLSSDQDADLRNRRGAQAHREEHLRHLRIDRQSRFRKPRLEAIPWTRFTVEAQANWNAKARCASAVWASWARLTTPASRKSRRRGREPEEKPAKEKE